MEEQFEAKNLPKDFHCPMSVGRFMKEMNLARTQPSEFAKKIRKLKESFIQDKLISFSGTRVTAIQGKAAYDQAINFLEDQKPLNPLQLNLALCLAADDHCVDMTENDMFGHKSTDGSGVRQRIEKRHGKGTIYGKMGECCDRVKSFHGPNYQLASVIRLIIDEGVPSRGHRKLIFTPEFTHAGISGRLGPTFLKITVDFCAVFLNCQNNKPNENQIGNKLEKNFARDQNQFKQERSEQKVKLNINKTTQKKQNNSKPTPNKVQKKTQSDEISKEETLKWVNIARTTPNKIVEILQDKLDNDFINDGMININGIRVRCLEGKKAYQEAIDFLNAQKPLHPLKLNECLNLAADDHVKDMVEKKIFGHTGSDGSSLTDRITRRHGKKIYAQLGECCDQPRKFEGPDFAKTTIIRYILDEGVPSRGHRKLIFTEDFNYIGISMRSDNDKGYKGTLDFCATNLQTKGQPQKMEEKPSNPSKPPVNVQKNVNKTTTNSTTKNTTNNNQIKTDKDEVSKEQILKWVNIARTTPNKIAEILQGRLDNDFINDKMININGTHVQCLQGKKAYQETINYLNAQKPLHPLKLNQCLSLAADDHVKDMIAKKIFGHTGSDGSSLTDRITRRHGKKIYSQLGQCCDQPRQFEGPDMAKTTIIRYILDEGVPSRGHRKLIFTEGFNYIGISMRSDNNGGYKGTLDLCSSDLQTKGNQSNTTTPVQNNSRNETPKKSPSVHKNNANMKLISHENESDIFDKMKMGNNKGKVNKSAQSVSTSTKTVTKNGIKTTTVTKVTKYTDGSTQTVTTTT